jgi:type I restriction enzyme S subunit
MLHTIKIGVLINEGKAHSQTGPFGTQLKASEYVNDGIPVINVRNVGLGKINGDALEYISEEKAVELSSHLLQNNDIVFGRKGAIERHGLISTKENGWIQGSDCIRLRILTPEHNTKFISYFFRTKRHQQWMINLGSFGATMGSLNQDIINRIEIPDISVEVQDKIASILSTYDELIDNNNQRISLLEQMAEEIYKEWFVRLRFPGHKQTRIVDGVPDGWMVVPFSRLYDTSSGGTPSRKQSDYYDGEIPWIKTGELNDSFILDADEMITERALEKSSAKLFPANTVIIAMYGATIGMLGILSESSATNQACAVFLPKERGFGRAFAFFFMKINRKQLILLAQGAAQQNISQAVIGKFLSLRPQVSLVEKFTEITEPMLDEILMLQQKTKILKQTRDLLLPRVMSGKLSVEHLLDSDF